MSSKTDLSSAANASDGVDVSIVLVTWNALDVTADALASVEKHAKDISHEVFVIDNGTTRDATT